MCSSDLTEVAVMDRARRSRALVYPIAIGDGRQAWLGELAAITGGRSLAVKDPRALEPALASVAEELRYQYLLGYAPTRPGTPDDGGWRRIHVDVVPGADLRVRARDGYDSRSLAVNRP